MTTEKSDTPKTEQAIKAYVGSVAMGEDDRWVVFADFARQLERELAEANAKIDTITTDPNYEGGSHYWMRKHDALLSQLAADIMEFERLANQLAEATNQIGEFRTREADASDCFAEMWKQRDEARDAIATFVKESGWCHGDWKNQPHVKPLFDIAAGLDGAK